MLFKGLNISKSPSYYKILTEGSFSSGAITKVLTAFIRLLQKRTGKKYFGSPDIYEYIQTPNGKFYTFTYDFGQGQSIRFKISTGNSATIHSIDFFMKPYAQYPSFTMDTQNINLIQLLDIVSLTINKSMTSSESIIFESKKHYKKVYESNKSYIQQLADGLSASASGLKKYLLSQDSPELQNVLSNINRDEQFKDLMITYNSWANKNKQTLYKSYIILKSQIYKAQIQTGLRKGATVEVKVAKKGKEVSLPTKSDIEIENYAAKFKATPDEIFQEMYEYTEDVALGKSFSLIIAGDPGVGKTYGVEEVLQKNGYSVEEVDPQIQWVEEEKEEGEDETYEEAYIRLKEKLVPLMPTIEPNKFVLVKGKVTAAALYAMLWLYNGALIVFDDTDTALKADPLLIKAATDDKKVRKISATTKDSMNMKPDPKGTKSIIPPSFLYTGRVIFITNLYLEQIDSAIITRARVIEINLTFEEMMDRAKKLTPKIITEVPGANMKLANEVLDFLISEREAFGKLDLRTYKQSIETRVKGSPDWKKRVGRAIMNKQRAGKSI